MKISLNGKYLHKVQMQYFDYDNIILSYPENRIELIEVKPQLILAMPEKLVIQLLLDNVLSKNENNPIRISISGEKERNYIFLDAKFQHDRAFMENEHVRLFFREIKIANLKNK